MLFPRSATGLCFKNAQRKSAPESTRNCDKRECSETVYLNKINICAAEFRFCDFLFLWSLLSSKQKEYTEIVSPEIVLLLVPLAKVLRAYAIVNSSVLHVPVCAYEYKHVSPNFTEHVWLYFGRFSKKFKELSSINLAGKTLTIFLSERTITRVYTFGKKVHLGVLQIIVQGVMSGPTQASFGFKYNYWKKIKTSLKPYVLVSRYLT